MVWMGEDGCTLFIEIILYIWSRLSKIVKNEGCGPINSNQPRYIIDYFTDITTNASYSRVEPEVQTSVISQGETIYVFNITIIQSLKDSQMEKVKVF